jgi:hypothetical protein
MYLEFKRPVWITYGRAVTMQAALAFICSLFYHADEVRWVTDAITSATPRRLLAADAHRWVRLGTHRYFGGRY